MKDPFGFNQMIEDIRNKKHGLIFCEWRIKKKLISYFQNI